MASVWVAKWAELKEYVSAVAKEILMVVSLVLSVVETTVVQLVKGMVDKTVAVLDA